MQPYLRLRISFGRVTCMAWAASVPGLWTLGFLLLCGACVWARVVFGLGFRLTPPLVAGVVGCVCVCVRAPLVPRHSWLGCAVWLCVLGLGFWLCPATPGWGVGFLQCFDLHGFRVYFLSRHRFDLLLLWYSGTQHSKGKILESQILIFIM